MTQPAPYQENPDFVPDPTLVSGTLDTSQTGGGHHDSLSGISRVFHRAEEVFHHLAEARAERGHPQPAGAPGEPVETGADPQAAQEPAKPQEAPVAEASTAPAEDK